MPWENCFSQGAFLLPRWSVFGPSKRRCTMILFRPENVPLVLSGRKTQTRRRWKRPRVKVGSVHQAKTGFKKDEVFARIRITGLRQERLGDISPEDVYREGYDTWDEFAAVWRRIHGSAPDPDEIVWVVDFVRVD